MAGLEVDYENLRVTLDLHDLTVSTALVQVELVCQEAYLNGFRCVYVIHGAPEVQSVEETLYHGAIKMSVLGMLDLGEWDEYVARYERENGATVIWLKPNSNPRRPEWTSAPEAEYGSK